MVASAIWQCAMDQVLQVISGTQYYMDVIIVTGPDDANQLAYLDTVLLRLKGYGVRAKRSKCELFKDY